MAQTQNHATQNITHKPGTFIWLEVRTKDVQKTARIMSEVAGWKISTMPMGDFDYTLASTQHGPIAGIVPLEKGQRAETITYVSTDDVDAALARVTKAGGTAAGVPFDVPTIGRMVEVKDPDGAPFFLMKSATGDAELPRAQGSVHWNELWSRDPKKAVAFFTSVLGYSVETMPMGGAPYHVLKANGVNAGGIMAVPAADVAPRFVQYLVVDDVEAAVARAKKHGCAIDGPVQEVDGIGRFAYVRTDEGVSFGVMTPAA